MKGCLDNIERVLCIQKYGGMRRHKFMHKIVAYVFGPSENSPYDNFVSWAPNRRFDYEVSEYGYPITIDRHHTCLIMLETNASHFLQKLDSRGMLNDREYYRLDLTNSDNPVHSIINQDYIMI